MELTKKEKDLFKSLKKRAQVAIDILEPYPLRFIRKLEALPPEKFEFSFDVAEGYGDGIIDAIKDLREFIDHLDDVLHGLEYWKEREQEKEELKRNPPIPTITFSDNLPQTMALHKEEQGFFELKQTNQNNGTNNRTQRPQGDTTSKG